MPGTRRSPGYSSSASTWKPARTSAVTMLPEPPEAFLEVVVPPVLQPVDAERDGMVVEHEQLAARLERARDAARPRVEVGRAARSRPPASRRGRSGRAAAPPAAPQRPPGSRGSSATARAPRRAAARDGSTAVTTAPCSASSALASPVPHCRCSTRFAARSPSVAFTIAGSPGAGRRRLRCSVVERAPVEVGRFHQAGSEKPPSTMSVWPHTIAASAEQRKRHRACDVVGLDEPARGRALGRAEHLLACSGSARARRCRRRRPTRR